MAAPAVLGEGLVTEIKRKFELVEVKPTLVSPTSPVLVGFAVEAEVKGKVGPKGASAKVSLKMDSKGKFSYEAEKMVKTALGKVKFKVEVEPGKASKLGIEFEATGVPLVVEIDANMDISKPFSFKFKTPETGVRDLPVGEEMYLTGLVQFSGSINFAPNPAWPGWPAAFAAARQAGLALVQKAQFLRVFYGGQISAISNFATVAALPVLAITWIGFGLYQIGKAGREGRHLAVGYKFSSGYARMLVELTSDPFSYAIRNVDEHLKTLDWKGIVASHTRLYVEGGNGAEFALDDIEDAGAAAIFQDISRYVAMHGAEAWERIRRNHLIKYGQSPILRKDRYLNVLHRQVKEGSATLGIPDAFRA